MKTEKHDMSGSKLSDKEMKAYFKKNPKAAKDKWVYKAARIALDHGGAMNYAIKQIDKVKRGLSKHPEVKKALRWANESTHSTARSKFKAIVTENYTKNFQNLCIALKFNPIQQKILENFITTGLVENQYVGRVAGKAKETKTYAASRKYKGSNENIKEALMKALKVNTQQKNILNKYLNTGRVIGKYIGSVAGTKKTTKDFAGFQGFTEQSYPTLFEELNEARKPKADGKSFTWNRETHPALADDIVTVDIEMASWDKKGNLYNWEDDPKENKPYNKPEVEKRFKIKFKRTSGHHSAGYVWDIKGKAEDVFFYLTTEYQGNSASGKESPNSDIDLEFFMLYHPFIYSSYGSESVDEVKRYVKGGFTFEVEGKPKRGALTPDTLLKPKQKKMWPSVKIVFVKSKDHWKATGSEKDLERLAWAVDQAEHLKRTSGRDEDGNLIKEGWLDVKKIQLKYRKEISYLKKNNNAKGSKKEQELLDAIASILSKKERGDWSDPDFADLKALDLIWDDEWDRLK